MDEIFDKISELLNNNEFELIDGDNTWRKFRNVDAGNDFSNEFFSHTFDIELSDKEDPEFDKFCDKTAIGDTGFYCIDNALLWNENISQEEREIIIETLFILTDKCGFNIVCFSENAQVINLTNGVIFAYMILCTDNLQ